MKRPAFLSALPSHLRSGSRLVGLTLSLTVAGASMVHAAPSAVTLSGRRIVIQDAGWNAVNSAQIGAQTVEIIPEETVEIIPENAAPAVPPVSTVPPVVPVTLGPPAAVSPRADQRAAGSMDLRAAFRPLPATSPSYSAVTASSLRGTETGDLPSWANLSIFLVPGRAGGVTIGYTMLNTQKDTVLFTDPATISLKMSGQIARGSLSHTNTSRQESFIPSGTMETGTIFIPDASAGTLTLEWKISASGSKAGVYTVRHSWNLTARTLAGR